MAFRAKRLLMPLVIAAGFANVAQSAVVSPSFAEAKRGTVSKVLAGRDNINNANTKDGSFFSLGKGGLAVFDFGKVIGAGTLSLTETTFSCAVAGALCGNHAESARIFVSDSYTGGSFDISSFKEIGQIGNAQGVNGIDLSFENARYVAVLDTTAGDSPSFDGFDIDSISLTAIPLPASIASMGLGLLGLAYLRRRS